MAQSVWVGLAPWVLAAAMAVGCGDESGSERPGVGEGAPGSVAAGAGGASPPGAAGNAGLDDGPVVGGGGATDPGGGEGSMAGATAAGGASAGEMREAAFPSSVTRPRLLIIGDSISAGPGCYKKYLLAALNGAGFSNFDFVGEYTDDCGGGVMHGARSCSTAQQYTQPEFTLQAECGAGPWPGLSALAAEHSPDLMMLQLGVNDVWGGMAI